MTEKKKVKIVTSHITALEIITGYKKTGKEEFISKFWQMLEDFGIELLVFNKRGCVEKAAQIRADFNLRTPDAIQLSLAIKEKIPCFVTNDEKLKAIKELKILCLKDYI